MHDAPLPPPAPLLVRPTWLLVLGLAWPVLVQQLLIVLVPLSDGYLAGNFMRDVASQAAQTTALYVSWLIASCAALVNVGSTALVARFCGAGDRDMATRVTNQALLLAATLGSATAVVGVLAAGPMVWLLGLRGEAAVLATNYLIPTFGLLTFLTVEGAGIACLEGAGDTRTGLWVRGGIAVGNLPLAWLLFHGFGPIPGLGFTGIALGTALSHVLGALAVVLVLFRGRAGLSLDPVQLRPDREILRRMLRVSLPAALNSVSGALCQFWFLAIVNGLGDTAASAHGIALRWEALAFLSGSAFGVAAMTLVGQNLGAGRPDRAARSGWTAFALGCGVMSGMGVLFFTLAPQMFRLFCPAAEQTPIVAEGVPVLRLVAFAMPPLACTIIFTSSLNGAGDTRGPVVVTWLGFLGVRIPLAYLFTAALGLGLFGAWLAMFADLVVRGTIFLHRFAAGRWKEVRV
jgi:putative MATE family efflux protein